MMFLHSGTNKYMLFMGQEVRIGKNCGQGPGYSPRSATLKTEGTAFPNTDWPRPVYNVFFYCLFEDKRGQLLEN